MIYPGLLMIYNVLLVLIGFRGFLRILFLGIAILLSYALYKNKKQEAIAGSVFITLVAMYRMRSLIFSLFKTFFGLIPLVLIGVGIAYFLSQVLRQDEKEENVEEKVEEETPCEFLISYEDEGKRCFYCKVNRMEVNEEIRKKICSYEYCYENCQIYQKEKGLVE